MSYQQGSHNIGSGLTSVSVNFPTPMEAAPSLVVVSVENTTDASPLQHLDPVVKSKSAIGFTVEFSAATATANYKLVWMAGNQNKEYQGVSASGVKVTGLPRRNAAPGPDDLMVFVDMSTNTPFTAAAPWQYVSNVFGKMVSPPAGPTSPGSQGFWSMDTNYFYSHDGSIWGRTPRVTLDWDLPADTEFVQEGTEELTTGQSVVAVTFATPFDTPPNIYFFFENTSVQSSRQIVTGLVTTRTPSGFAVSLNTSVDTSNYRMNWRATGTPA